MSVFPSISVTLRIHRRSWSWIFSFFFRKKKDKKITFVSASPSQSVNPECSFRQQQQDQSQNQTPINSSFHPAPRKGKAGPECQGQATNHSDHPGEGCRHSVLWTSLWPRRVSNIEQLNRKGLTFVQRRNQGLVLSSSFHNITSYHWLLGECTPGPLPHRSSIQDSINLGYNIPRKSCMFTERAQTSLPQTIQQNNCTWCSHCIRYCKQPRYDIVWVHLYPSIPLYTGDLVTGRSEGIMGLGSWASSRKTVTKVEMRRAPIGSHIWIFGPQLVDCLGRIKGCGLVRRGASSEWTLSF